MPTYWGCLMGRSPNKTNFRKISEVVAMSVRWPTWLWLRLRWHLPWCWTPPIWCPWSNRTNTIWLQNGGTEIPRTPKGDPNTHKMQPQHSKSAELPKLERVRRPWILHPYHHSPPFTIHQSPFTIHQSQFTIPIHQHSEPASQQRQIIEF